MPKNLRIKLTINCKYQTNYIPDFPFFYTYKSRNLKWDYILLYKQSADRKKVCCNSF